MAILSNLEHGWCDFDLEGFHGTPSYIRFVPMDILNGWEEYQNTGHCIIEFDEEITKFCVIVWDERVMIISDSRICYFAKIKGKELLKQLVADVINNINKWAEWIAFDETHKDSVTKSLEKKIHSLGLV